MLEVLSCGRSKITNLKATPSKTANVQKAVLAGVPSKPALDMMLSSLGWKPRYYEWKNAGIRNWAHIDDYQEGYRVTSRVDASL